MAISALGCAPEDRDKDLADYHAERVAGIDRLNGQEGMPDAWLPHFASDAGATVEEAAPVPPLVGDAR